MENTEDTENIVEISGKKHSVYIYGQGPAAIALLSGSGVPFPNLEYLSLANAFAGTRQVIVMEKSGYGYSDISEKNRDVDTVVGEYRYVLQALSIKTPLILAAHSMGFLEALRWGQQYPKEVLGILGIDAATPECYREFDLEKAIDGLTLMSKNQEIRKQAANALMAQLVEEHPLAPKEKERLEKFLYRNLANQNWISEAENLKDALSLIEKDGPYLQIPMLFFISNGEGTTIEKEAWRGHTLEYLKHVKDAQYAFFDYPHNLYKFVHEEMAGITNQFIAEHITESGCNADRSL